MSADWIVATVPTPTIDSLFPPKHDTAAVSVDPAAIDRINLVSMFNSLDAYGQRVTLAQMAAMLRVQNGGK